MHLQAEGDADCLADVGKKILVHAGQPIVYPRNDLSYSENFLHMLFSVPSEEYVMDPELARAMEIILVLHMDHEQNASTSTVRTAGDLTSVSCPEGL